MSFDQSSIVDGPTISPDGQDLLVTWTATDGPGTMFQLYMNGSLAWHGTKRSVRLPWPTGDVRVAVGTVGFDEGSVDYSWLLPSAPADRVLLEWHGGTWQGADLAGFRLYMSTSPGGAVDFATPVATIPATVAGVGLDGWGIFPWGSGRWGKSSVPYSWTSDRLASGVWTFAVAPFDLAGNQQGSPLSVSATVASPPRPPAADASGARLSYTLNPATRVPTLTWLASPG